MEGHPRAVGGAHDPGLGDRKYVFFFKMYQALCCSQEGWKVQDVRGREARGEERSGVWVWPQHCWVLTKSKGD